MAKFLFTYRVPKDHQPGAQSGRAWEAWFESLGNSRIDTGHAVVATRTPGSLDAQTRLGGYSLVIAKDIDGAAALATGCPALQLGGGVGDRRLPGDRQAQHHRHDPSAPAAGVRDHPARPVGADVPVRLRRLDPHPWRKLHELPHGRIFVTTVLFGAQNTAIGMAEDLHSGLIERFQSLVMARSAVLAGRVLADALRNVFVIAFMLGVGYLVGFRLHTNAAARSQPARAREGVDRGSHDRAGRAHCRGSRRVIIGRREGQPRSSVRTSRGNGHAGVPRPGRRRGSSRAQIAGQQRLGGQRPSNCGPRGRRTPAC